MIDTFYRIRALHARGLKLHLHAFEYGRQHAAELESFCESVRYYKRRQGFIYQLSSLPYSVVTRNSLTLIRDLSKDDYPIFFDGLHTTGFIDHPCLAGRKKLIRLHNREDEYYRKLASFEKEPLRKVYFLLESLKLQRYEKILRKADILIPISDNDQGYFKSTYGRSEMVFPFHPFERVESGTGFGDYILYHADMTINENIAIARFLVSDVFAGIPGRFIIAGKQPPRDLAKLVSKNKNIELIPDPDQKGMMDLIGNSHINILPSLSSDGFKLKLIMSLFKGRHCLANKNMTEGSWLESLCFHAESPEEFREEIKRLMQQPFTEDMRSDRISLLQLNYDNDLNAKIISELI